MQMYGISWHNFQKEGYARNPATSQSLGTDRMEFARENVGRPPKKIVDFGCADASFSAELAAMGFEVIGVDFEEVLSSFSPLYDSRKALFPGLKLRYVACNLDEKMIEETFDIALCLEIAEHLLRDFDFLCKVRERLNANGKIILSVPINTSIMMGDHHLRCYNEASIVKILYHAGYNEIKTKIGDNSILVTAFGSGAS